MTSWRRPARNSDVVHGDYLIRCVYYTVCDILENAKADIWRLKARCFRQMGLVSLAVEEKVNFILTCPATAPVLNCITISTGCSLDPQDSRV